MGGMDAYGSGLVILLVVWFAATITQGVLGVKAYDKATLGPDGKPAVAATEEMEAVHKSSIVGLSAAGVVLVYAVIGAAAAGRKSVRSGGFDGLSAASVNSFW